MQSRHRFGIAAALVGALASVLTVPELPEQVATHWNAAGQPDGYAPRWVALVGLPALAVGTLAMLVVAPHIDPWARTSPPSDRPTTGSRSP